MKNEFMTIGEIADFFGVSRKAMRLYEKKGIIRPAQVDPVNGYRYYSPDQVQQLNALTELKALGFSLDEIKTIPEGKTAKGPLLEMLEKKRQHTEKIWELLGKENGNCAGSPERIDASE